MDTSTSTMAEPSAPFVRDQLWKNWSGNVTARPAFTVRPTDEQGVVEAVRFAVDQGLKVRVVGTGHSWTGLCDTDGVQIDVSGLSFVRVADRERKLVTVGAGTSVWDANVALWDEGFSLKNQGDIDVQTIAGAASTGTHGSGVSLQNIASSIRRIKMVDGRGELVEITGEDPETLRAARVALGTVGVFVEVDLEVVDRYYLQEEVVYPGWEEIVERWDADVQRYHHSSMIWFPKQGSPALFDIEVPDDVDFVDHAVKRRITKVEGPAQHVDDQHFTDRNYLVYHGSITGPYIELEYFVPAERSLEVMSRLRDNVVHENPEEEYGIQPRWVKADDAHLSPCYGRDSVGISVVGSTRTDFMTYLRKVHDIFMEYDARPHWGKFHFFDREAVRRTFPEYDAFNRVRAAHDPDGIFLNDLTGQLFG